MNIHYQSPSIANFYKFNRVNWSQFYESEQFVFEKVFIEHSEIKNVLDVGCACGGLGRALNERFGIDSYFGIDINPGAIEVALLEQPNHSIKTEFVCDDIVSDPEKLRGKHFDLVVSLSCADWNTDTKKIIQTCWDRTANGGYFVFSFRLTNRETLDGISKGYQFVQFDEEAECREGEERAPYIVTNISEALDMINSFSPMPDKLIGYGYWGKPSSMAVIPYANIVFAVFAVRKNLGSTGVVADLKLPLDLLV